MKLKATPFSKRYIEVKTPTLPKINHKVLLIALSTVLVLALLTAGLAVTEAHKKAEDKQAAITAQAAVAAQNARNKQLADLKQQVAGQTAKTKQACDYLQSLTTQKATKPYVKLPMACNS